MLQPKMKTSHVSLNGKKQSSQSCSKHTVQSFTAVLYWKESLSCEREDGADK